MTNFEETSCSALAIKYKLHFENANFSKGLIPRKILLDRTRNIHSYFVFCKLENEVLESIYWTKDNFSKSIKSMIAKQYSDLGRPLFFVFQNKDNKYKAIEGGELREAILEQPDLDINQIIIDSSYSLNDLILKIKKEI